MRIYGLLGVIILAPYGKASKNKQKASRKASKKIKATTFFMILLSDRIILFATKVTYGFR